MRRIMAILAKSSKPLGGELKVRAACPNGTIGGFFDALDGKLAR